MNLAKNGAVLLAALSVFAMTSCKNDQGKTITFDQAKAWLDERCPEERITKKVKTATYDWDYSKSTGESLIKEGMPRLISYSITQEESDFVTPIEGTEAKKATDFECTFEEDETLQITQMNGEKIESYVKKFDSDGPNKCVLKNKKLYITFNRTEEMDDDSDDGHCEILLEQTDVYTEDCYASEYTLKLPDDEINYAGLTITPGPGKVVPEFSGVAKGYVHTVYSEFFTE